MTYRRPNSLQQAQPLVGTRVQVWGDQPGRWHPATLVEALHDELGDDGEPIKGCHTHFLLSYDEPYEAQVDREHISFDEAFNGFTEEGEVAVEVVETPAEAGRLLEDLRVRTAAEKGKAVLHSGGPSSQKLTSSETADSNPGQGAGTQVAVVPRVDSDTDSIGGRTRNRRKRPAPNNLPGDADAWENHISDAEELPDAAAEMGQGAKRRRPNPSSRLRPTADTRDIGPVKEPGGAVGHAGQIKSILCQNFMCHSHFELNFMPHLNFVSGANGSGKSASLQALQCCLGVQARKTGRAANFAELIQDGAPSGLVSVTIWNTGSDAVMPEALGSQITIERRLQRSGAAPYTIKDELGRKVPMKKQDVDELLDALSICAGNAAVVLSQETAKTFSSEVSEKAKYDVFMSAMRLDEVNERLTQAQMMIEQINNITAEQETRLEVEKAEKQRLEALLRDLMEIGKIQETHDLLLQVMAWEVHNFLSDNVGKNRQRLERELPEKLQRLNVKLGVAQEVVAHAEGALTDKRSVAADQAPRLQQLTAEVTDLRGRKREAGAARRRADLDESQAQEALASVQAERQALHEDLAEARERKASGPQASESRFQKDMRSMESRLEGAQAEVSTSRQEEAAANEAIRQAARLVQERQQAVTDADGRIKELQGHLQRLQAQQTDPVTAFAPGGIDMRVFNRLMDSIRQAAQQGRFSHPPIGPLGSCLRLNNDKWALAAEVILNKHLGAFVVHNTQDQRLLWELAIKAGFPKERWPFTLVVKFDRPLDDINSGPPLPPPSLTTLYQELLFPENHPYQHVIRNVVTQMGRAERAVLCNDMLEGRNILNPQLSRPFHQRNVTVCYAPNGDQVDLKNRTVTTRPMNRQLQRRLQRDVKGQITSTQRDLRQAQTGFQEAQTALTAARLEHDVAKQGKLAAMAAKRRAETALCQTETELQQLTLSQPPSTDAVDLEINGLMAQVATLGREVQAAEREVRVKQHALDAAKEADTAAEDALQAKGADIEAVNAEVEQIQEDIAGAEQNIRDAAAQEHYWQIKMDALRARQVQDTEGLRQQQAQLAELRQQAEEICSEEVGSAARAHLLDLWAQQAPTQQSLEERLQPDQLKKERRRLELKIQRQERAAGASLGQVKAELHQLTGSVLRLTAEHNSLLGSAELLETGIEARLATQHAIKAALQENTSRRFNQFLNTGRGFNGRIKVDHTNHKLIMRVSLGTNKAPVEDMKSLSGGERSFTTLCFLLALACEVVSPFHALDEFDVFQDSVGRQMGLRLLMKFAVQYQEKQFLLLSPLGVDALYHAKHSVENTEGLFDEFQFKVMQLKPARPSP